MLFELLHTEAMCQRRVDLERFFRRALLLPRWKRGDRLHVVQPIGELDDQHPGVLRYGDHHLSSRCRLLGFLRIEVHTIELGHAVDDVRYRFPELLHDLIERQRGVFDRIVQKRRRDRHIVEPKL